MSPTALLALVSALAVLVAPPPADARARAGGVARIGYLHVQPFAAEPSPERRAFLEELGARGYKVGQNLVVEYRSAVMRPEFLPDFVEELVAAKVDVIVAIGSEAGQAARAGTTTVPIVVVGTADPVRAGWVDALARPGRNVTGVDFMNSGLAGKRLQFLREAVPAASRVGVLWNPGNIGSTQEWQALRAAGQPQGIALQPFEVRGVADWPTALARLRSARPEVLYVVGDSLTTSMRFLIAEAARELRLPTMCSWSEFVEAGGLMAYSPTFDDLFRRAAAHVSRILDGARPADLPVEQPTTFELVVNLETARTLNLTIPQSLLLRADRLIR